MIHTDDQVPTLLRDERSGFLPSMSHNSSTPGLNSIDCTVLLRFDIFLTSGHVFWSLASVLWSMIENAKAFILPTTSSPSSPCKLYDVPIGTLKSSR